MRFVVLILLVISLPLRGQSRKEARQQKRIEAFNEVKAIINSSSYVFTARRANPQGGRTIDLTTHSSYLIVINDSVSAHLPFFGRAQSAGYSASGGGGIKFQGTMNDYNVSENSKKPSLRIKFKVSAPGDSFDCTLEVFSKSSANLSVISQNRSHISYDGLIESYKQ
jgi:hypothetical protein